MRRLAAFVLCLAMCACDPNPVFKQDDIDRAVLGKGLRAGFLLGAASAAHQTEGGNSNDWTDWENSTYPDGRSHINDGTVSGLGPDSWHHFDDDVSALQKLGANSYRLSIEWSRVETQEGVWDDAALDKYLAWMTQLRAAGIEPIVTLNHFTLPRWVAARGGWSNDDILEPFDAYVARSLSNRFSFPATM